MWKCTTKMCSWAYTQRLIFWVLERTLKGSFFGSLSVRSKGHFLGLSQGDLLFQFVTTRGLNVTICSSNSVPVWSQDENNASLSQGNLLFQFVTTWGLNVTLYGSHSVPVWSQNENNASLSQGNLLFQFVTTRVSRYYSEYTHGYKIRLDLH